ncbi:MAG: ferredoxin-NADP reductase [Dehalococcoidia bacterium DG_18]|nr:MAG: ferredoxin-NADP reductase [Dehalococcoidia bacterium DG_18]
MYRIMLREDPVPNIHLLKIEAPAVARKAQAGQFVIIRVDEKGERIPLSIADWDREEGGITIVFNEVGRTTRKLAHLEAGDEIANFVGPLGLPAEIEKFGTVACVAIGYGVVTMVPIARALKEAGNRVISVIWAQSQNMLFGDERLGSFSDQLIVNTDDGSYGRKGSILDVLEELLRGSERIDRVIIIGPTCMMKFCSAITKLFEVKTIVSLNPIMVDGTGMCGCCRVEVGGETKFACVDGPEFDGHEVDWDLLMARRCTYPAEKGRALMYHCQNCAQW